MKLKLTILFTFLLSNSACDFLGQSDSSGTPGDLVIKTSMCENNGESLATDDVVVGSNEDAYRFLCSSSHLYSAQKFEGLGEAVECKVHFNEQVSYDDGNGNQISELEMKKEALKEVFPLAPVELVFQDADISRNMVSDVIQPSQYQSENESLESRTDGFSLFFYQNTSGELRAIWTRSRLWEFLGEVNTITELSWRARLQMKDLYFCESQEAHYTNSQYSWDIHNYYRKGCGWNHLYDFSFDTRGRLVTGNYESSPNQIDCESGY